MVSQREIYLTSTSQAGELALRWADELGLVASTLFRPSEAEPALDLQSSHFALVDGRRGSFVCSEIRTAEAYAELSRNWRWSADLAHHVLVSADSVTVRSGLYEQHRTFSRRSVESRLSDFITYLDTAPERELPDVILFLINEFKQFWAELPSTPTGGSEALTAFLIALTAAGHEDPGIFADTQWRRDEALHLGLGAEHLDALTGLSENAIRRGRTLQSRAPSGLRLVPELVLRHAAGRLFQEAHGFIEAVQLGLFGEAEVAVAHSYSPTGAFFTPLPIARLVAEAALNRWNTLPSNLVIADYACGSGVFLTEALRVLERRGFRGSVNLVGRDISSEAVTLATVAIAAVSRDLTEMSVQTNLRVADVTELDDWPSADVVLINPPFRSWEQMNASQRHWVRVTLPDEIRGRPDLSVAFIEKALGAMNPAGVMATLVPAGVLASEGLAKWRARILERATPSVVAVLGEHDLFDHALVNIGIMVLQSVAGGAQPTPLNVAWASTELGAASHAIRSLRKLLNKVPRDLGAERSDTIGLKPREWTALRTTLRSWKERPSWLPGPGLLGEMLDALRAVNRLTVEDLFKVRQGIRTGAKDVFLISSDVYAQLPDKEKFFFVPAVETSSFVEGELQPRRFLFMPDPNWEDEVRLRAACPQYFAQVLSVARHRLIKRSGIKAGRWWELTRSRGWMFDGRSRLVSKRFGLQPAFARDPSGKVAIVQGNAWVPREPTKLVEARSEILTAYWWLLNSRVAVALFREYCPNVAGGQLDLEHKYVKHVPLPDLRVRLQDDPTLLELAVSIRSVHGERLPALAERDRFAAAAYGTVLSDWPIASSGPTGG